uniref:CSON011835 protein n=1 Tax=Culicoides sonorensis TaxID=179676 RepID=A0A336KKV6_CULSO
MEFNCRFCLCETVEPRNIVDDTNFIQKSDEIFNQLEIQIRPGNGLSVVICDYCYNFINEFYSFYENVKENQVYLKNELHTVDLDHKPDNLSEYEVQIVLETEEIGTEMEISDQNSKINNKSTTKKKSFQLSQSQIMKYKAGAPLDKCDVKKLDGNPLFICDNCDKFYTNKAVFTNHVMKCLNVSIKRRQFEDKPSYRKVPNPDELTISCHLCPSHAIKFKSEEILALHLTEHDRFDRIDQNRLNRGLPQLMQCPHCERRYGNPDEFKIHLKNHESGRFMTCELCGRSIITSCLKTHLKLHFKKFCCEFCSHKFRTRCDLMRHIRLNHERPEYYECHHCLKKIKHKSVLEKHLENCRGPNTVGPCVHCGETFSSKSDRMYHVQKYHIGYICRTCGIQVDGVTALKNHRKSDGHKQKSNEARMRREKLKQEKMTIKKEPLRKVTFGLYVA